MKNTIIVIVAIAAMLFSACAGEAKHKAFNEKDATGATMVWTESNRDLIYEMEKMLNPF